jgi:lysozyme family protein
VTAIFISHRSSDNAEAQSLKDWLRGEGHEQLFLDFDPADGIPAGVDWEQRLYRELRRCQAVLIALTPAWLDSIWCRNELAIAREKGKAIFVARVKDCKEGPLAPAIQEVDLTRDRAGGLAKLARGLKEHGLDPADAFDWHPSRPIYPGLAAFDVDDAAVFFGRSEESCQVIEAVRRMRVQATGAPKLLLITGASGSGKSSLMRAGVLARLRKERASWIVARPFRCGADALGTLADALLSLYPAAQRPGREAAIALLSGGEGPRRLLAMARELRAAFGQPDATLVLAIDQAEELLDAERAEEATRLLDLLRDALIEVRDEIVVVATIRSDRLGDWQQHKSVKASPENKGAAGQHGELAFEMLPVGPMPMERIGEIVRGPAAYEGLGVEDELVEAMRADTDTPDALPLLAYTLRYMHDRLGSNRTLSLARYRSFGGLEGSIRSQADAAIPVERLSEEQVKALREAFVPGLVRANSDGSFSRARVRLSTLPPLAEPYLRRLIDDARLLQTDRDAKGNVTIEVAHESLLRVWPTLVRWIAEDAQSLRRLEALQRAASDWAQNQRGEDYLVHRDHRLTDIEALVAEPRFGDRLEDAERAYLAACRARQAQHEAEEKEARERELRAAQDLARRRRHQTILASTAAVIILALGGAATWMFRELAAARESQVAQLQNENSVLSRLLRQEYQQRFDSATVPPTRQEMVAQSVRRILDNRARYEAVTKATTMPWYFVAIIHGLEADFNFDSHLHNGDPLTSRTVHVPAGRPAHGTPPFSWEESAIDAIAVNRYDKWNDWSIAGMLVIWERYNGLGYRRHGINSPYVWACTDLYTKGRYVADGRFDTNAEFNHCGAVAMLKGLIASGSVSPPAGPK